MRSVLKYIAIVLAILSPLTMNATHIIGGEVNYTCLGDNEYELTLTVYRDCFYADPNVFFDDPASLAVFDANGFLVKGLLLPLMNNDTLTPILSDSCLFVPENVCVHTTTYRDTIELPFKVGGYTVAYQRCCRNQTIVNIVDPLNTGATFTAEITETALLECNSGAKFEEWPPLFICVNEPINYDHSATDAEGDSLVYKLCTPFAGGDMQNNQPQPPPPPPYETINWLTPTYGEDNMLGYGIPMSIDPETGLISGTPSIHGQYVVGVCLEEYRNGELISTTRRDFQYNVGDCGVVAAVIGNDSIQCENLNVEFINESSNANDFEWYYGDPDMPGVNSTLESPSYEYPDTGNYTITLIVEPNGECADTSTQNIYLKNSTLSVGFNYFVLECVDSVVLSVNNFSEDEGLGIESYLWTLNDGQTSNLENPVFVLNRSQEYELNLEVETIDGCVENSEVTFFANVLDGGIQDTLELCPGDGVELNPAAYEGPNIIYSWSPTEGLDNPNAINPYASPSESTVYTVTIQDSINMCFGTFSLFVDIQENNAIIDLGEQVTTCEESILLSASTNEINTFLWSDQADFSSVLSTENTLLVNHQGVANYYLQTTDDRGCIFEDEIEVTIGSLEVETGSNETSACTNNNFTFSIINNDPGDDLEINWQPAASLVNGQNSLEATFNVDLEGLQTFTATIENQYGCTEEISFEILIISNAAPTDFEIIQTGCEANELTFISNHPNIENFYWEINDPNNPGLTLTGANVSHTYADAGTYTVALKPIDGLPCELPSVEKSFFIPASYFETNFDLEVISCGDEIEVQIQDLSIAFNDEIRNIKWTFSNGQVYNGQLLNLSFMESGAYTFTVDLLTLKGCNFSYNGDFNLDGSLLMDASFIAERILSCDGAPVEINSNGNPNWEYLWTPANGLSSVNIMNPIADVSSSTTYNVQITDPNNNCTINRTLTVEIPIVPLYADFTFEYLSCLDVLEVQMSDLSEYSNGEIVSWNWTLSDGQSFDNQNPLISFSNAEDVSITLDILTDDACEASITKDLSVSLVSINIPEEGNPLFICFGESIELNPGGSTAYEYLWSPGDGLSSTFAASPIASPNQTTEYTLLVSDPITGCEVERTLVIEVPTELPQPAFDWNYVSCDNPAEITFNNLSTYADGELLNYEWLFQGNSVRASTEEHPTLILDENQSVSVNLTIIADDGCTNTYTEEILFNIIDFNIDIESVIVCPNEAVGLNPNFDPSLLYEWSPADGLDNPFAGNPMAFPNESTIYTVLITDPNNGSCEVTDQVEALVPASTVEVDYSLNYISCGEEALIQLNDLSFAEIEIVSWNWTVNNTDTYNEQNPVVEVNESGMLMINLMITTIDGCEYELLIPQGVNVDLIDMESFNAANVNICLGEEATLNELGNQNYTYEWEGVEASQVNEVSPIVTPTETTTYSVTITNVSIDTCQIVSEVTVMVYEQPNFTIEGESEICEKEGLLSVALESGETVQWSDDPNFNNILSNEENLTVDPGLAGTTYYAQVLNEFGCGSEVQEFQVNSFYFEIQLQEDYTICIGDTLEINIETTFGEEPVFWNWSDDVSIIENNGSSLLIAPLASTTLSLQASNSNDCSSELLTSMIEVVDIGANIDLSADKESIELGESANLLLASEGLYDYNWSPAGSLNDAEISNPIASPTETTTYTVTLEDDNGCSYTDAITIIVLASPPPPPVTPCDEPYVFIPNAFTPNGDNLNDQLKVDGNEIETMHLVIYNRYGEKVFETNDQNETWDGSYKGKLLDTDVFGYYLQVSCFNGDNFYKQGNISLLK